MLFIGPMSPPSRNPDRTRPHPAGAERGTLEAGVTQPTPELVGRRSQMQWLGRCLGEAMAGLDVRSMPESEQFASRGW